MASKRKIPSTGLERRVRPRREEEWEPEPDISDGSSGDEEGIPEEGSRSDDDQDEDDESNSSQDSEPEEEPSAAANLASISFGALAKAQASLPERQGKKHKGAASSQQPEKGGDEEDGDKKREEMRPWESKRKIPKPPKRSSKHAPLEQSSKRPVSRKRDIAIDAERPPARRDPRFDSAVATKLDETKARKAYAFLDEYREKELADLKAQVKKTKDPVQKENLKRRVMAMESRKKARKQKDDEERLLAEHRKQEKELVAQGKQPFYLKKSEQKKQLLTNKFAGMTKGQAERAVERKRKKVAGKEKKQLGDMQRVTDRHG